MQSAGPKPEATHGELNDDELEQISGGATRLLYDITVAGMRIHATYNDETGDSRTCVTTKSGGTGCTTSSPS